MGATKAATAKADAEKTKAERAEDAKWRTCPGCDMERRVMTWSEVIMQGD